MEVRSKVRGLDLKNNPVETEVAKEPAGLSPGEALKCKNIAHKAVKPGLLQFPMLKLRMSERIVVHP